MLTNNSLVNSTCRGQYFSEEQRESVKGTEQELERLEIGGEITANNNMKRNEPGIEEGGKIVASNNAKGNVPGIGKGSIFAANSIGRETGKDKEAKL